MDSHLVRLLATDKEQGWPSGRGVGRSGQILLSALVTTGTSLDHTSPRSYPDHCGQSDHPEFEIKGFKPINCLTINNCSIELYKTI